MERLLERGRTVNVPAVKVKYNCGNIVYGFEDVTNVTAQRMTYSISNKIVTVTANSNDGYGFINVKAYLEKGKSYQFSCTTDGTWGYSEEEDTVEAFLMLNGTTATYYHMDNNTGYIFTPTVTGTYYLRLDVNKSGATHKFSNISIHQVITEEKGYGAKLNAFPNVTKDGYSLDGWYTAETGGSKISTSTTVPATDVNYYAHWVDDIGPTCTKVEIKNVTVTGYDVYVYGVTDAGSGINRVQFPTWTEYNNQDDIQTNWPTSETAKGTLQSDGTTWVYRVNVTDHKNESGKYNTHVYIYDNNGNYSIIEKQVNVPAIKVTFNSGNLVYGFNNVTNITSGSMMYSSDNGKVTVTAKADDGHGFVNGKVYLEAGKQCKFSCTTNGTWGSSGDTVEAYLMLNGATATYYHMDNNTGYVFTPTVTGVYYLRLDVNKSGATHTFSNIKVQQITVQEKGYGSTIGTFPTVSRSGYTLQGWYTAETGGTKVSTSTTITTSNLVYYAQWADTTKPTSTKVEIKNITATGYDVYVYGVADAGSGISRVQFPTWTTNNNQDDIQPSWSVNETAKGTLQSDGTTWIYRVNVTDHKNEFGEYNTHVYIYDNDGNYSVVEKTIDVPSVKVTFNSGNLVYGFNNVTNVTNGSMTYSSTNGKVTVTAKADDGHGLVNIKVYLEASKQYKFSCTTNGTWGSSGDTVEAYLMLNGAGTTYYHMDNNTGYVFTPTVTGIYYLRLDVNKSGATHTFSNIKVQQITVQEKGYGSTIGTLPTVSRSGYTLQGWYTAETGGTKISTPTTVPANNVTYYAQWVDSAPLYTSVEIKNLTANGYDVYVYGVTDDGSGINRVQFPTWTTNRGQDDLQANWTTGELARGTLQSDGTTWVYRVNMTDHKNESGEYNTHVYIYDNNGNSTKIEKKINVPKAVARINTTYYTTLASAISAAGTTNSTIVMLANVSENVTVNSGQNIAINLNSYTVSSSNSTSIITNKGTLYISNGTLSTTSGTGNAITNSGTLTISDGTVSGITRAIYNASGNTSIIGGTVKTVGTSGSGASYTVEGKAGNIYISAGTVSADQGSSTNRALAVYIHDSANLTVSGTAIIKGTHTGIQGSGSGTIKIQGGTISSEKVLSGDSYSAKTIYASNNVEMTGGTINAPAGGIGIYSCSTGSVTMNSNDATISGNTGSTGIQQTGTGSITIKAGSIKCYTSAIDKSSTGVVTIGENTSTLYGKTGNNILYLQSYGTTVTAESATIRYYNGTIETSSNLSSDAFALSTKTQSRVTAYNTAGLKVRKGDALWQYTK